MRIAGTHYNLNHKALEIYVSGCHPPHCEGCHNEGLWDFERGNHVFSTESKSLNIKLNDLMVENIWILGGEPLDQDLSVLRFMLYEWKKWSNGRPIMLWTRYTEIPKQISEYLDFAKIGEYREELPSYVDPVFGITLASSNQKIIKLSKKELDK